MTKKEQNKVITQLSKDMRALLKINPRVLRNATIMVHGFTDETLDKATEVGFEFKAEYKTGYREPYKAFEKKYVDMDNDVKIDFTIFS